MENNLWHALKISEEGLIWFMKHVWDLCIKKLFCYVLFLNDSRW